MNVNTTRWFHISSILSRGASTRFSVYICRKRTLNWNHGNKTQLVLSLSYHFHVWYFETHVLCPQQQISVPVRYPPISFSSSSDNFRPHCNSKIVSLSSLVNQPTPDSGENNFGSVQQLYCNKNKKSKYNCMTSYTPIRSRWSNVMGLLLIYNSFC